jgi:recombinational DNA repair ATPase RecF
MRVIWDTKPIIEEKRNIDMEEIKLPKFKTKEELEQFAMGLMTENKSLKKVIICKDETIKSLDKQLANLMSEVFISEARRKKIQSLESEIKSLKEKESENYYKILYEKESDYHAETMKKGMDYQHKFEKAEEMVRKLLTIVTFMYGLLNRFQAKRVFHAFEKFKAADYRL